MENLKISPATILTREASLIDRQLGAKPPQASIPIVSPVLHVVSMTIVVFLRRKFGYAYLQPVPQFLVIGLALVIFTSFAWTSRDEFSIWHQYAHLCAFGFISLILFFWHCLTCNIREWLKKAPHDNSSGKSWLGLHYSIESCLVFITGALLFLDHTEFVALGFWLMISAIALSIKEPLNRWYQLRVVKMNEDSHAESKHTMKDTSKQERQPLRKSSKHRKKASPPKPVTASTSALQIRYAAVLGMEPPFNLAKAEKEYRSKQKAAHPDSNPSPAANAEFQQLREAIHFFRTHYS
jgi:hypothetical protein